MQQCTGLRFTVQAQTGLPMGQEMDHSLSDTGYGGNSWDPSLLEAHLSCLNPSPLLSQDSCLESGLPVAMACIPGTATVKQEPPV